MTQILFTPTRQNDPPYPFPDSVIPSEVGSFVQRMIPESRNLLFFGDKVRDCLSAGLNKEFRQEKKEDPRYSACICGDEVRLTSDGN